MSEGLDPLAGYATSDTDTTSATLQYSGFMNANGAYYVLQSTYSGNVIAFRYYAASGLTQYQTDWSNRANLAYDYYANIFKNS